MNTYHRYQYKQEKDQKWAICTRSSFYRTFKIGLKKYIKISVNKKLKLNQTKLNVGYGLNGKKFEFPTTSQKAESK